MYSLTSANMKSTKRFRSLFWSSAQVFQGVQVTEAGLCNHSSAVNAHTADGFGNPLRVAGEQCIVFRCSCELYHTQLIRMQVTKCTTTGFLTGLGGLITLPATITADIGSSMYVQIRMIAAIAVMGGYSLQDDVVKSMVFATLLKVEVGNLLKQVGVKTANRASLQLLKKLPGTVLTAFFIDVSARSA